MSCPRLSLPHLYLLHLLPPCIFLHQANPRNVQIGLGGVRDALISCREVKRSDAHGGGNCFGHVGFSHHFWGLEPLEPEQSLSAGGGWGRLRLGALERAVACAQAAVRAPYFVGPHGVLLRLSCPGRGGQRGLDGWEDLEVGHSRLRFGWAWDLGPFSSFTGYSFPSVFLIGLGCGLWKG